MTLIEELQAAAPKQLDPEVGRLMTAAATALTTREKETTVQEKLAVLLEIVSVLKGVKVIRYDRMSLVGPPRKFTLAVCPDCNLPGKVKESKNWVRYIHTSKKRRHGEERPVIYCKTSRDGRDGEVVLPGGSQE